MRKRLTRMEAARRQGTIDFLNGVPLSKNPMRTVGARLQWEEAWKTTKKQSEIEGKWVRKMIQERGHGRKPMVE